MTNNSFIDPTGAFSSSACNINYSAASVGNQVKHLNQYTANFVSSNGEFPITLVASTIEEAAKLASLPGVISPEAVQPTSVKFAASTVAVAMPVNMIGFETEIQPSEAIQAGALATPEAFEVRNGENIIFQATTPFGWVFDGWYKYGQIDADGNPVKLSSSEIAEIDVYDNYASRVKYIAQFTQEKAFRTGIYLDLQDGAYHQFDFTETAYSTIGMVKLYLGTMNEVTYKIDNSSTITDGGIVTLIPVSTGPGGVVTTPGLPVDSNNLTADISFSAVGVNLTINTFPTDTNPFGWTTKPHTLYLKYLSHI